MYFVMLILLLQVKNQAREVYEKYFKAAQATPRGVVAQLCNIVTQLETACDKHTNQQLKVSKPAIFAQVILNPYV